jgi:hypothetical protein
VSRRTAIQYSEFGYIPILISECSPSTVQNHKPSSVYTFFFRVLYPHMACAHTFVNLPEMCPDLCVILIPCCTYAHTHSTVSTSRHFSYRTHRTKLFLHLRTKLYFCCLFARHYFAHHHTHTLNSTYTHSYISPYTNMPTCFVLFPCGKQFSFLIILSNKAYERYNVMYRAMNFLSF